MSHFTRAIIIWIIGLIVCLFVWLLASSGFVPAAIVVFFVSLLILGWLVWSGIRDFYKSYN